MAHTKKTLDSALERVFREHSQQLFISALAVTGCPEGAEDAVQEAFYRLFRMECKPRYLKAYVFRSVRNAALNQSKERSPESIEDVEFIFAADEGPGDSAERSEFRQRAAQAMKALSADERETVISRLYADLTFRQIAKVRGMSINTVWSWYRRGMAKLRRQLGDES
jgi:RNA polymerase sigma-70 factor (ECF subfamily)